MHVETDMRLDRSSDYALRLLMLLSKSTNPISIGVAGQRLNLPKSQMMKIAASLSKAGFLDNRRGRGGGIRLRVAASEIHVGSVIKALENNLGVVDCLRSGPCDCVFLPRCGLMRTMSGATEAFFAYLDRYTLADVASRTITPFSDA